MSESAMEVDRKEAADAAPVLHPGRREVRARPIDVYRRLPIARLKEENVYEYWGEDESGGTQRATKSELEHGVVGSSKKQKRLNIPTPIYHTVEDYESRAQAKPKTAQGPFLRGRPPPRAAPSRDWEAVSIFCTTNAFTAIKEEEEEDKDEGASEYILSHEDVAWLGNDFVHSIKSKAAASANRKSAQQAAERADALWLASSGATAAAAASGKVATRRNGGLVLTGGKPMQEPVSSQSKAEARAAAAIAAMTEDALEALLEAMEVATGPASNSPVSASRATEILCNPDPPRSGGLGPRLSAPFQANKDAASLAAGVCHSYWLAKRRKYNKPLLRRFWPKTAPTDANPHSVFRPREKERYKLRKHRKNDVDAFRKLQHLRKDFEHARELFSAIKNRELVKRATLDLKRGSVRRLLEQGAGRSDNSLQGCFADTRSDFDPRLPPEAFLPASSTTKTHPPAPSPFPESKPSTTENNHTENKKADEALSPTLPPVSTKAVITETLPRPPPSPMEVDTIDPTKSIVLTHTLAAAITARLEACAPIKAPPPPPPPTGIEDEQLDSPAVRTEQQRKPKRKNRRIPKDEEPPAPSKDTKHTKSRPCVPTRGFMESHWWLRGPDAARASRALGGLLEPNLVVHKVNDGVPTRSSHLRQRARLGRGGRLIFDVYECHAISVINSQRPPSVQSQQQSTPAAGPHARPVQAMPSTHLGQAADRHTQSEASQRPRQPGPPAVTYATKARRALVSPLGDAIHDTWCLQDKDELARLRRDHCLDEYYDDITDYSWEDEAGSDHDDNDDDQLTAKTARHDSMYSAWDVDNLHQPQCRFASVPSRQASATIAPTRLAEIAALSDSEDEELVNPENDPAATLLPHQLSRLKFALDV